MGLDPIYFCLRDERIGGRIVAHAAFGLVAEEGGRA
jgi:hypothetical protein